MNHLRKWAALLLALALIVAAAGCKREGNVTPTPTPTVAPPAIETPAPAMTPPPSTAELTPDTLAALDAMMPVYDSIARACNDVSLELRYLRPNDDTFVWSVLYYLCTNYGHVLEGVEVGSTQYQVPLATMEALMQTCFYGKTTLPDIPPQTFPITYDDAWNAYFVDMSDAGMTTSVVLDYHANTDSSYTALIGRITPDEDVPGGERLAAAYRFTLREKTGVAENEFAFAVEDARVTNTDILRVWEILEKDGAQVATVDLLSFVSHTADELNENGEPYGSDYHEWVLLEEGIEVEIAEDAEFHFDRFDELFDDINIANAMADSYRFFLVNAGRETDDGEHLVFYVNMYNNVVFGGTFAEDYFFAG